MRHVTRTQIAPIFRHGVSKLQTWGYGNQVRRSSRVLRPSRSPRFTLELCHIVWDWASVPRDLGPTKLPHSIIIACAGGACMLSVNFAWSIAKTAYRTHGHTNT